MAQPPRIAGLALAAGLAAGLALPGGGTEKPRRPLTIHDLLTHTAGMSYGPGPAQAAYDAAGMKDWYLVGQDETLRRQAQKALTETSKLVTLGEMTTGMAHELNTPIGNALIVSSTMHDQQQRFQQTVLDRRQGQRAAREAGPVTIALQHQIPPAQGPGEGHWRRQGHRGRAGLAPRRPPQADRRRGRRWELAQGQAPAAPG